MFKPKIIWTQQAKTALKSIFDYYKERSLQGANTLKAELLLSPKTIHFAKQYQIDEINPKYRRIVVRDYKVLYKEIRGSLYVMDIVCTLQSPEILRNK
jgi:plasmid stabilization system protein ParE